MELPTFITPNIETNNLAPVSPIKRKRLTQACDACRKKKVKCSGDKPSCNNCTRLGTTCTYLPSSRKRGPRVGLVESLEKRLQQMEKLLQPLREQGIVDNAEDKKPVKRIRLNSKNSETEDSEIPNNPYTPNDSNEQPPQQPVGQSEFLNGFQAPQVEQQHQREQNRISNNITSEEEDELLFFGNSSAKPGYCHPKMCKLKLEQALEENDDHSSPSESNDSADDSSINSPITIIRNDGLPPEDIVLHLAACFFRHIDVQMPMLHEATFMRQLRQNRVAPFLVYAICAVSARYSKHQSIIQKPPYKSGEPFANIAINKYLFETFDNPTVEHVQGLILITLHMYGSGQGPRSWMFTGMAVRMAQELGLHKVDEARSNPSKSSEDFFIQQEIRRRTLWSCFLLDRFSACALGRPTLIDEDDCDVGLPCHEKIWNLEHPLESPLIDEFFEEQNKHDARLTPTNSGMSASLVSVTALLGRICQHVNRSKPSNALPPWNPNSQFSALETELDTWYKSLIFHHNYTRERMHQLMSNGLGATFAAIHLLYYSAIVLLNRTNNITSFQNDEVTNSRISFMREKCCKAAMRISSIAADITQYGNQYFCPFSLYPVFVTTNVHLDYVYNSNIEISEGAKKSLETNELFLKELGPYWAMASKLLYFIRDMKKQADDDQLYKGNGSELGRDLIVVPDPGVKTQWNRFNNNNPVMEANFDNLSSIIFPEQLFSPRLFYDTTFMGDSLTNFLRSPGPFSPNFLRLTKKENDNSNQDDSSFEYDYFSQDLTAYNSIQAPPAFVYDGNSMMDWSTTAGRVFSLNRPMIEDTPSISTSTNITPLVTTSSTGDMNIDPVLI